MNGCHCTRTKPWLQSSHIGGTSRSRGPLDSRLQPCCTSLVCWWWLSDMLVMQIPYHWLRPGCLVGSNEQLLPGLSERLRLPTSSAPAPSGLSCSKMYVESLRLRPGSTELGGGFPCRLSPCPIFCLRRALLYPFITNSYKFQAWSTSCLVWTRSCNLQSQHQI